MHQARDEAVSNRIGRVGHDNGNCGGCPLQRRQGSRYPGDKEIDFQSHELRRNLRKSLIPSFQRAPLDDEILSFDIAKLVHALHECGVRAGSS
jgi:hypothetical protein